MNTNNADKSSSWKNWIIKKLLSNDSTKEDILNFIANDEDEKDLEDLINEIRSPKGTTHAGIISLKRDKVKNKIDKAFKAAELRSKEIQNEYK